MTRFIVTVGGTRIMEGEDAEDAARRAVDFLLTSPKWKVEMTDVDIGNRIRLEVPNPTIPEDA